MKKLFNIFAVILLAVFSSSCLESNLEELDVYSGCDITGRDLYWRYVSDEVHPGTGANKVIQKRIPYYGGQSPIDTEACTAHIAYSLLYSNLTEAEKAAFDEKKAVVIVSISTAATIKPIEGAPELGVPGDWSKPNKYEITAADGTKKVWTITISKVN